MAFSYFFRDLQTLDLIKDQVLPVIGSRRFIDVWSAGCAMGQEPYTIATLLRENMGQMIFRNVRILATDIDGSNLFGDIIRRGSYPEGELQRMPGELFQRYFMPDNEKEGYYQISEEIRKRVTFIRHNLLSYTPVRSSMGLIVCKNVLLHFSHEERLKVLQMFYDALDTGGFLITEHTQKMPSEMMSRFTQVVSNAQIFQKT